MSYLPPIAVSSPLSVPERLKDKLLAFFPLASATGEMGSRVRNDNTTYFCGDAVKTVLSRQELAALIIFICKLSREYI
jgi:hypothetical protein